MPRRFLLATCLAAQLAVFAPEAIAGHPMLSEDTGTQGSGNAELELGFARSSDNGSHSFLFQPQLSYGVSPSLDLIVQPSWLANDDPVDGHVHGFGDTNLDVKWRFYGAAPLSLGVRAGFEVPTDQHDLGLPHGDASTHVLLVATVDTEPLTLDANLGYVRNPNDAGLRTDLYHVSAAATLAVSESLYLVVDAAADSNPDTSQGSWPAVVLAGVIYTVHPGLDLDAGYRAGLNPVAVASQWLLGITYRWAP